MTSRKCASSLVNADFSFAYSNSALNATPDGSRDARRRGRRSMNMQAANILRRPNICRTIILKQSVLNHNHLFCEAQITAPWPTRPSCTRCTSRCWHRWCRSCCITSLCWTLSVRRRPMTSGSSPAPVSCSLIMSNLKDRYAQSLTQG